MRLQANEDGYNGMGESSCEYANANANDGADKNEDE